MNGTTSIQDEIIEHPTFSIIANKIIHKTGLAYYWNHLEELARNVRIRMAHTQYSTLDDYVGLLDDREHNGDEFDELAKLLTIGETHFFRHHNLMEALRHDVFPELIKWQRNQQRLRIWSAGCSIGAEPYSLSIMLHKYFGAQTQDWNISILGTDINRDFLSQAIQGQYSAWALRGIDEALRSSCFNFDGTHWNIKDIYKQQVRFQYHNLATDPLPIAQEAGGFDLILCRNVFIYFNPTTIQQIACRFRESLNNNGYLAIGHSEMNITHFSDFFRDHRMKAPIYQKVEPRSTPDNVSPLVCPPLTDIQIQSVLQSSNVKSTPPINQQAPNRFLAVDRCANAGRIDQAIDICTDAIFKDRLDPEAYCRRAMLLQEQGCLEEAAVSARQAVYLARSSPLAHYLHGTIHQLQGDHEKADKSFRSAINLLDTIDSSTIIDKSIDMTAGDLLRIINLHRQEGNSI